MYVCTHRFPLTGGSKGLGFAMAREFLSAGDGVVLCGREVSRLDAAAAALCSEFPSATVAALPCDVSDVAQVCPPEAPAEARQCPSYVPRWCHLPGSSMTLRYIYVSVPVYQSPVLDALSHSG